MLQKIKEYRLLVAYLILAAMVGLAFMQAASVRTQIATEAVARTDLREREALLRTNVLCEASNELRVELRAFFDESGADYGDRFALQECPPPPTDADFDFQDRRERDLPEEPPGDQEIREDR